MARLEEITPGALVTGLATGGPAEVVAVRRFVSDALEVTYKVDGRVLQSVVYRDDEPRLSLQGRARRFALDADGSDFKLALGGAAHSSCSSVRPLRRPALLADRPAAPSVNRGL